MNAFDKIIGYSGIKKELRQISDTLKNSEVYEALGVSAPKGLLLHGVPGVGKSLMASAVIEESGRRVFTCRKDKPNGDFVKEIKATFDKAAENAPSIVFLDDLDKFANSDPQRSNTDEYVTVQSCIDEAKGKKVFALATANDLCLLPRSLRRVGRFDRVICVDVPHGKDAEKIVSHYLKDKKYVADVDARTISRIMDGWSCAVLETVINEAGLLAGFERAEEITMEHFMEACMRTIFEVPADDDDCDYDFDDEDAQIQQVDTQNKSFEWLSQVVYHEVGHAVVSEILCPESVTLISAHNRGEKSGGFTSYYRDYSIVPLYWDKSRIISSLGGAAAVEQKFGIFGAGCSYDFKNAFEGTRILIERSCMCGFHLHGNSDGIFDDSPRLLSDQEQATSAEIEKYYRKAKEIISLNAEFFEKLADALAKKRLLSAIDIKQIKERCKIVPVSL